MDMSDYRELATSPGTFASVYLDASHNTEDAEHALQLRVMGVHEELTSLGADEATVTAVRDAALTGPKPVGRAGRALIVSARRVLVDRVLPQPPATPIVRFSSTPYLLPLIAQAMPPVPYVVVLVDRLGADLRGYVSQGELATTVRVLGHDHPIHKVGGTGWTHLKMQHRVENTAKHNAQEVADAVAALTDELHAELIVIAGEVQARTELRDALPRRCQKIAVTVLTGGRADGVDETALEAEVRQVVADFAAAIEEQEVDRFVKELSSDRGVAVQGLPEVVAALRESRADTVFMVESLLPEQPVWTGAEPGQLATEESDLTGTGTVAVSRSRVDEALPLVAARIGAKVVVPAGHVELTDGVGTLLRYAQPGG